MKIGSYETHPAADLFPLMEGDEFNALVKSMIERGWDPRRPAERYKGLILDGRNRLRAAEVANVTPVIVEWNGADPYDYVWAHNVVRRHLNEGQLALIRSDFNAAKRAEIEIKKEAANEARSRAASEGRVGRAAAKDQSRLPTDETKPNAKGSIAARELAKDAEVSVDTAQKALVVKDQAPELAAQVKAGEKSLSAAYKELKGIPQHSGESPEWYTPTDYVEAARAALGGTIDFDPASCDQANETVRAGVYYTEHDNGLAQLCTGNGFVNPPGGLVKEFWNWLVGLWRAGYVERAIWIGYSLEQLQVLQQFETTPLDFPLCFPRRRIAFESPGGGKKSPTHANYIAFLPSIRGGRDEVKRFESAFAPFGRVVSWELPHEVDADADEPEEPEQTPPAPATDESKLPNLDHPDSAHRPAGWVPGPNDAVARPAIVLCQHGAPSGDCLVNLCAHRAALPATAEKKGRKRGPRGRRDTRRRA